MLNTLPLFDGLDVASIESIKSISFQKKFTKNSILHYENEEPEYLYYIIEGSLRLYKVDRFDNEIFLYNVYQHEFVSEFTDFETICCFANAEFLEDSALLAVDYRKLEQIFSRYPQVAYRFFLHFAKRVKKMQCIINREIVFDGTAKVAHMLANDLVMFNRFKKQEIAQMLNIQPETLSRILKKLSRQGIIDTDQREIQILDMESLKEIFEQ